MIVIRRFSALFAGLALVLALLVSPHLTEASAVPPQPLVPNPITVATVDDDSTRGIHVFTEANCTGTRYTIVPGFTSEAWLRDVDSFRLFADARIGYYRLSTGDYLGLILKNVPSGGQLCYGSTTNDREYAVYTADGIVS